MRPRRPGPLHSKVEVQDNAHNHHGSRSRMTAGQTLATIIQFRPPQFGPLMQYAGSQIRTGICTMFTNALGTTSAGTNAALDVVVLIRWVAVASVIRNQTRRMRLVVLLVVL